VDETDGNVDETDGNVDEAGGDDIDAGWYGWLLVIGGGIVLSFIVWRRHNDGGGKRPSQDTDHR
ncbi:MAG: hypothetical protein ACQETB_05380, partial [Halobacteriota archaeon]